MRVLIGSLCLAVGMTINVATAPAASLGLFGTVEFKAESLAALPQWRRVLQGIAAEDATYRACAADPRACPGRSAMAWRALLDGLDGAPRMEQIRAVNRFVNQWRYKSDQENFGKSDHWQTPLEFFARSGDCEDYAIAKYVSLRQLGVPPSAMRMVVLQDTIRDVAHAVLAVEADDDIWILDNLTNAVLPHTRLAHYAPYYSVNEQARWAHVSRSSTLVTAIDPRILRGDRPGAQR